MDVEKSRGNLFPFPFPFAGAVRTNYLLHWNAAWEFSCFITRRLPIWNALSGFGYFNCFICLLNLDLWFWIGQGGRIRWISPHDSGSCHSVLPSSRNPDGQPPLQQCHWHLVCRLHLCRAAGPKDIVSGTESHPAGRIPFPFNGFSTAQSALPGSESWAGRNGMKSNQDKGGDGIWERTALWTSRA